MDHDGEEPPSEASSVRIVIPEPAIFPSQESMAIDIEPLAEANVNAPVDDVILIMTDEISGQTDDEMDESASHIPVQSRHGRLLHLWIRRRFPLCSRNTILFCIAVGIVLVYFEVYSNELFELFKFLVPL